MNGIKLVLGIKDNELDSASVPVGWCLDKNSMEDTWNDLNLFVFITTYSVEHLLITDRKLVRLEEGRTYVNFHKSGKNHIHAYLVGCADDKITALESELLSKVGHSYNTDPLFHSKLTGEVEYAMYTQHGSILGKDLIDLYVPKNVFGKESHGWFNDMTNLWLRGKAKDECAYRWRMGGALFKIVPWGITYMAFSIFYVMVFMAILLLGFDKHISFKDLAYSFKRRFLYPTDIIGPDILPELSDNDAVRSRYVVTTKAGKTWYSGMLFSPMFIVLVAFLVYSGGVYIIPVVAIPMCLAFIAIDLYRNSLPKTLKSSIKKVIHELKQVWFGVLILTGLVAVLIYGLFTVTGPYGGTVALVAIVIALIYSKNVFNKTPSDVSNVDINLLCEDVVNEKDGTLKIDHERDTIKLKYLDFKHKVCKPMTK